MKKPIVLMILDGYGLSESLHGNAIRAAKKPNLDRYFKEYPNTLLSASGLDVGLPRGQIGNSEVGHTNIGAGRVVYQELTRISKEIEEGGFFKNKELLAAMEQVKKTRGALHLLGLLSDGGVHSHNAHLYALVEMAKREGIEKVFIHAFMDGRDVGPTTGLSYMEDCAGELSKIGLGKVATVMGRFYAMDRDSRWDRVEKAYAAMVYGEGEKEKDPVRAMQRAYDRGETDEFVLPTVIEGTERVKPGDAIVFFNFRPDRAREITRAFVDEQFSGFERKMGYFPVYYVCMTQYDAKMPGVSVAFLPQSLSNTFGEYISKFGLRQLRIAETEKYAHVTFFFNGGVENVYEGEERILIPSPKSVATYDQKPEMSAFEVTDALLKEIDKEKFDVVILNYANCDMVGHTGVFDAAVWAVETVDACVGRVVDEVLKKGGVALITADHGNADQMTEENSDDPFTAHTTNPVPLIVIGAGELKLKPGKISDLTPTMLEIMGLEKPKEMESESLILK